MLFNREPALILGALNALIALAVGFGLDLTSEQQALIGVAVTAILSVLVRQRVTPSVDVPPPPAVYTEADANVHLQ